MLKAALDENNCRDLIEQIDHTIQKHLALDDGGIYKSWTEIIRQFVFMLEKIQDKRTNEKTKKNLLIVLKKNMMQIINEHHSCAKGLITYLGNIYTENYFKLISILQQHESHLEASIQRQLHQNLEDLVYSIKIWKKDPKEKPTWLFEALNKEHIPEFAKKQIIQLLSKDLNETNNMVGAENVHYSNLLHIFLAPKQNKDLIKKFKNTNFDFERFTLLPYADLYERYPLSELVRDQTFYNLYKTGLTQLTSNIAFDNQEWLQSPNPIELENHPARYFEEAHTVLGQQGINIQDQKTCLNLIECSTGNLKNTPIAVYAAFEEIMANKDASHYTTPKRLTLQDIKAFMDDIEKKGNQNPKDTDVISYYKKIHSIAFDMVRNPLGQYQKEDSFGCQTCHSVEAHHQRFLHWVQTQDVEDNYPLKKHLTKEANHHLLRNIALPFIGLILMETGLLYKYRPNKTYGRTITTSISQIQKTSPHHPKQKKSNAFPIPISPRKSLVQCIEHTADLLVFLVQLPMNLLAALFPIKHHWIFINPIYVLLETPYAILRGCVNLFKYLCRYPQSSNNTYFSYKTCSINTRITLLDLVKIGVFTLPKHCLGLLLHLPLTVVELAYQSVKLSLKTIYNSTRVFIDSIFVYPCYVLSCLIVAVLKHILKPTLSALGRTLYATGTLLVQGFQLASTTLLTGLHTCIFTPLYFILNQTLEKALTIGRITHAILNLILWNPIRKLYHYPLAIASSLNPIKSLNLKRMSFSKEVTSITWNQEPKTPNPMNHKAITH